MDLQSPACLLGDSSAHGTRWGGPVAVSVLVLLWERNVSVHESIPMVFPGSGKVEIKAIGSHGISLMGYFLITEAVRRATPSC